MKASITSKVDSMTSDVDQELYAQVPEDDRMLVREAEFALVVSTEKTKLAEYKKKLANKEKKYASYALDLAKKNKKAAAIELDIAKLEAIDRSGLGEKQDNIKTIADLKAKTLDIESDKVKIEAKLSTTKMDIENLKNQIKVMEEVINSMKMAEQ
jgi:chromosome segregation ATPase